ncbi:hypothetical protein Psal006b_01050 [Piscirickettsia salmonis]|uniref:UPF0229 protein KU39_2153 n=1 Tax=Piscirickettsia salmonis TaxID=1238 RepID=A0A1L6TD56_PISSA|nr:YeaH/YhbH family protein [Piscirickettsia salmonis]AKP74382.1 hypothetical protein PSLF89_2809 [Piscirickettsia salmonis LF-89 = ATCC VR-1361]ALB23333.1 hypothetical protein KU39_2153 [Piscirickettsia salmonis]ALY03229.1 hypothetical protein AWE47_10560 [Piscirickettsia salmonis]AMA42794.1 hypothetical protein AWJ11_10780 [Piscirickettsia salmonis]AOS35264.1 hypothetical protein AVM72_07915 [Piscirickettsia salmonis]
MSQFIDRRLNGKNKSAVNRQRFIRRFKQQIKRAVADAVSGRSITDLESGEKVSIPAKDLSEPHFHHGEGGRREIVHPGNDQFIAGDRVKRPQGSAGGRGSNASDSGEGEDDFGFEISRDEFLELFFEDLELPNLTKQKVGKTEVFDSVRAGFSVTGTPPSISIVRSFRNALARRIALAGPYREEIDLLEEKLQQENQNDNKNTRAEDECIGDDNNNVIQIKQDIQFLKKRIKSIPFIDSFDLRYHSRVKQPKPTTQAVMFCLMDVSGSMDQAKKDIAKRFFILLYLFLNRTYEHIDVVFIRHHTSAKEVDEEEFFYSRETGGTVVSSALELMKDVMAERYPTSEWNIYGAQASDGDNWNSDSPRCRDLLLTHIMPHVQYFAYTEIMSRHHQSLWDAYLEVSDACPHFSMQNIDSVKDIYPVFRKLFKRQAA